MRGCIVADCKDDDVDKVLLSILSPLQGEEAQRTSRPRAVLAALCLAGEPNVSEGSAQQVLGALASTVSERDGRGAHSRTTLDLAAIELGRSMWSQRLKESLMREYCCRPPRRRSKPGGLWGMVEVAGWAKSGLQPIMGCGALVERLQSGDRFEVLSAVFAAMVAAFEGKATNVPGLTDGLIMLLEQDWPESNAGAWALVWMTGWFKERKNPVWLPSEAEFEVLVSTLSRAPNDETSLKRFLIGILAKSSNQKSLSVIISELEDPDPEVRRAVAKALGKLGDEQAVPPLLAKLDDPDEEVRKAVAEALGELGDKQAVPLLLAKLRDPDAGVRVAVVQALAKLGDKETVPPLSAKLDDPDADVRRAVVKELAGMRNNETETKLLSCDLDGADPWLDPNEPITETRLAHAAERLGMTRQEVRSLYASMAADFHLRLA